jgi:hypothetical protein
MGLHTTQSFIIHVKTAETRSSFTCIIKVVYIYCNPICFLNIPIVDFVVAWSLNQSYLCGSYIETGVIRQFNISSNTKQFGNLSLPN